VLTDKAVTGDRRGFYHARAIADGSDDSFSTQASPEDDAGRFGWDRVRLGWERLCKISALVKLYVIRA
jgi:hypothetical protein